MLILRNHAGMFVTLYMHTMFSRYMLFTSEFIIIYLMIREAYQTPSHSCFHTAIIFKYATAEILIKTCERMIISLGS